MNDEKLRELATHMRKFADRHSNGVAPDVVRHWANDIEAALASAAPAAEPNAEIQRQLGEFYVSVDDEYDGYITIRCEAPNADLCDFIERAIRTALASQQEAPAEPVPSMCNCNWTYDKDGQHAIGCPLRPAAEQPYPGQEFFHAHNPNIKRAELAAMKGEPAALTEKIIKKLISDVCNTAAFFTMDYNRAKESGGNLVYGLDSRIEPIIRAALVKGEPDAEPIPLTKKMAEKMWLDMKSLKTLVCGCVVDGSPTVGLCTEHYTNWRHSIDYLQSSSQAAVPGAQDDWATRGERSRRAANREYDQEEK
jgi:hypothetical protein